MTVYTLPLDNLGMDDVPVVGGKNASLGEMLQNLSGLGVRVPSGFATTADAYREFLAHDQLDQRIASRLAETDVDNIAQLQSTGSDIRRWIMEVPFPEAMEKSIDIAYQTLEQDYGTEVSWAVRSSATAEDMPDASFAGQQETYLTSKAWKISSLRSVKCLHHSLMIVRLLTASIKAIAMKMSPCLRVFKK
jgi:pyruvate,water dikinase